MTTTTNQNKTEETKVSPVEKQNRIDSHKKTANHLDQASKYHLEAAKHHEADDHDKAAKSALTAQGHLILAHEGQKEEAKKYALNARK